MMLIDVRGKISMRVGLFVTSIAGSALMLLPIQASLAQSASSINSQGIVATVFLGNGPFGPPVYEPFTGVWKTTRLQKLSDGGVSTHKSELISAQDSRGATYRKTQPEAPDFAAPHSPAFFFVSVVDPSANVSISWNSAVKEATVFHMPEPVRTPGAQLAPQNVSPPSTPKPAPIQTGSRSEDLGEKATNGFEATGSRFIRVIPAGTAGNDRPLNIVEESWYSPELRVEVLHIVDDPRYGVTTTKLVKFERGEPDPSLFQVPDGFAVNEVYPGRQN
jgi:hypothetical protein